MIKTIVAILGLSTLIACVPMEDNMAAEAMMDDGAALHGDTMMESGDTMS